MNNYPLRQTMKMSELKGRVPKRHVFGPKNYDLRHPYSESALNSEYNSVLGILKIWKKKFRKYGP